MKDRIPTKILSNGAIRYGVYDETGTLIRYEYIKPEDEPTENGDALAKANLLPDDIATGLGLSGNPQVKDALSQLEALAIGASNYAYVITLVNSNGTPLRGVTIGGVTSPTGTSCITNDSGKAIGVSNSGNVTLSISNYVDIPNYTLTVKATSRINYVTLTVTAYANNYRQIDSSGTYAFSSGIDTVDICVVGGGGGGSPYSGGGGGYVTNVNNLVNPKTATITIGAGGAPSSSNGAYSGGNSSFNSYSATGGTGGGSQSGGNGNGAGGGMTADGTAGSIYEFGDTGRQLYSGGGGGGYSGSSASYGGAGGSPFGGHGKDMSHSYCNATGYGGGGGGGSTGNGFQGVVAIRWRYKA